MYTVPIEENLCIGHVWPVGCDVTASLEIYFREGCFRGKPYSDLPLSPCPCVHCSIQPSSVRVWGLEAEPLVWLSTD